MNTQHSSQHTIAEHVVLIGGGSTNALTAVRLAERGFRVTVLEKAKIGNGSSSRSAAGIRAQFSVEETVIGMQYAEWWYSHFHQILQTPAERCQPVIQQNGYLFLYEDPEQAAPAWKPSARTALARAWQMAQANVVMQQQIGLPVEILDLQEIQYRWPHIEPDYLVGATWCPTDGFLFPQMIYTEGFRRAQELGVRLLQDTGVSGATLRGGRIIALETSKGPIEADWFVNGTNAWAPRLSQHIGGMFLPVAPLKRYLYFLKPTRPIMSNEEWRRLPMTIYGMGAGRGAHTRPENELLLLAWAHETDPEPDFNDEDQDRIDPPFNHINGIDNYGYAILEQVMTFAPRLADAGGLIATTSGFYGTTPDANPLIGVDANQRNLVHAVGFSGHGLMHAPITSVLVEAIIAGDVKNGQVRLPSPFDSHSIDLAAFDPGRAFDPSKKEALVL
ncbi:MAG: FAD-binding oxidoreductase [Chloroflexi bacterium]|nr:MAG: FAD-binding oxidoreductase [Chloroflexota bacterium]